jgi:hypothetical protein
MTDAEATDTKLNDQEHGLERCEICGSESIHVYPEVKGEVPRPLMAVCLRCGSHYLEPSGWVDGDEDT